MTDSSTWRAVVWSTKIYRGDGVTPKGQWWLQVNANDEENNFDAGVVWMATDVLAILDQKEGE